MMPLTVRLPTWAVTPPSLDQIGSSPIGITIIATLLLHLVATQCWGFVAWRPKDIYLPAWRRWLVRRGLLWANSGFNRWGAASWWLSRRLAGKRMIDGLVWYTTHCMIVGVG